VKLGRFHPQQPRVALAINRRMTLFDIHTGKVAQSYELEKGGFEPVQFVSGGKQILTASGDWYDGDEGQILLWDTAGFAIMSSPTRRSHLHARRRMERKLLLPSVRGLTGRPVYPALERRERVGDVYCVCRRLPT
jgi:hypothetical protein